MKTAINSLGDLATIRTVTTAGGTFYSVKIYTEEAGGDEPYRLQIAHADADKKTNAALSDEQVLQKHLATSLARYGFTAKDLAQ
jgi:hypothetical protein